MCAAISAASSRESPVSFGFKLVNGRLSGSAHTRSGAAGTVGARASATTLHAATAVKTREAISCLIHADRARGSGRGGFITPLPQADPSQTARTRTTPRPRRSLIIFRRSEEHTSELQSQSNIVFPPLLAKKK